MNETMAESPDGLADLLESGLLNCTICSNVVEDPVLLPCLHSVCKKCLQDYKGEEHKDGIESKVTKCPECQTTILQKENGNNLMKDYFLVSLKELADSKDPRPKSCDYCGFDKKDVKATSRCLECQDNMCKHCTEAHHRTRLTRSHLVVPLETIREGRYDSDFRSFQKLCCHLHEDEAIKYFCTKCEIPICGKCKEGDHEKHYIIDVAKAGDKCKTQTKGLLTTVKGKIPKVESYLQFLEDYCSHIGTNESTILLTIEKAAQALHEAIDKHKTSLLLQLETACAAEKDDLHIKQENATALLKTLKSNVNYVDHIIKHGKAEEVLLLKPTLTNRLTQVIHFQPEQITKKLDFSFKSGSSKTRNMDIILGKVDIKHILLNQDSVQSISKADLSITAAMPDIGQAVEIVLHFDCKGKNDTRDIWPTGIDIDHEGNMVILDRENKSIKVFNSSGSLVSEFRSSRSFELGCPYDLAISNDGNIVITDYDNEELKVISKTGQYLMAIKGPLKYPRGVTVNEEGKILALDCHHRRLTIHNSSTGKVEKVIGGKTDDGFDMFTDPYYVTTSRTGHIIVSDWASPNIRIFDAQGKHLTKYGTYGSRTDQILQPYGVCCDDFGYIFVADNQNHRIHLLAPDGKFIRFLLTKEQGLWHPMAVAINNQGQLVITEALGKVKVFKYM